MAKRRSNSVLPVLISIAVLGGLLVWRPVGRPASIRQMAVPSPSPATTATAIAADGQMSLELTQKPAGDKTAWSLTVREKSSAWRQIWTDTLPDNVTLSVPYNAVSPDNKHIFIQELVPGKILYLVFSASGKPMNQTDQMIEFAETFRAKYPNLQISAASGWAAPALIVFNTDKADGSQGPSFWFDISSRSFIQLANRFN